jgi:hypothetical protein
VAAQSARRSGAKTGCGSSQRAPARSIRTTPPCKHGPPRLKARIGEALRGKPFGNFWKYRVGDWRVIADPGDGVMLITVVRLGNWREVYRR